MMREEHTFIFTAGEIAEAAKAEASYHEERAIFWDEEYLQAVALVRETAEIKIVELPVTGGSRVDVVVNYGDSAAYKRMGESYEKRAQHQADHDRFSSEYALYASQPPSVPYELSAADVHYFRLAGDARPK